VEHEHQGVAGGALGRLAVARVAGLEQRVGAAPEEGELLGVAAEVAHVALDAEALVGEGLDEARPLRAPVAGVAERPEGGDVPVEVAGAEGPLHLDSRAAHLGERLLGAALGAVAGEEGLEPEPDRLDLLELVDGQRRHPRPAVAEADDEPLALEPPQRLADRRHGDAVALGKLLKRQPLAGRAPKLGNLLPQQPVDAFLDRHNVEHVRLIFDQNSLKVNAQDVIAFESVPTARYAPRIGTRDAIDQNGQSFSTRARALPDTAFPVIFQQADLSSQQAQRHFLRATAAVLSLFSVAAVMGAIDTRWAGWAGAATFLASIIIGALAVTQNLERTWYDGRALAESAKSLTWLYVARGGDLGAAPDPDGALRERLRGLRAELAGLEFVVDVAGQDISEQMRELRQAPLARRKELYLRERLADQIQYYRRRLAEHRRGARRFRVAAWVAQLSGFVGAALKGAGILRIDLLGIAAAAAAALIAWLQTRDHVTLARAYRLTAEDLERVGEDVPAEDDETEWAAYVADAETAMSREHVMWLARRNRRQRP
jgi:hypothetical protein